MRSKFSYQVIFTFKLYDRALFTMLNPGDLAVYYVQNVERLIKCCIHWKLQSELRLSPFPWINNKFAIIYVKLNTLILNMYLIIDHLRSISKGQNIDADIM